MMKLIKNMSDIPVTINGKQVMGHPEMTILDLAKANGIDIPTLCYIKELTPTGACRICVVEVEGSRTLVASCHTPIAKGMVIQTHSPKVQETRRVIIELLMANHCGSCFLCDRANICELKQIAADLDVGMTRFNAPRKFYQVEDISPYIERDLSKCIVCRRCVRSCTEIAKKDILSVGYRAADSKIVYDSDKPLNSEACKDCGICITHCPTGALRTKRIFGAEKTGKPLIIKG
jgi:NADH dehydrogenase/NADH:ubiquinone oxidoreductase subunit G